MCLRNNIFQVVNHASGGGVLSHHSKVVVLLHQFGCKAHQNLQAQGGCASLNDFNGLGVAIARHDDVVTFGLHRTLGQGHGFGCRCGLIQHGGVGNGHGR